VASPAADTASFLAANIASLTAGTNLFVGQPRESPSSTGAQARLPVDAVFVAPVGGPTPLRSSGETAEFRIALVNVFVRNQDWKAGWDLAQSVLDAFNGLSGVPSGYQDADVQQSAPADFGQDNKGRFLFSVTVRLRWNQVT